MNKYFEVEKLLNDQFPVPSPFTWKIKDYQGNYDDGVYPWGTRVTVGVVKPVKFLWFTFYPYHTAGAIVPLADPRLPEYADILYAAEYAYTHWSMKEKVLVLNRES